MKTAIGEMYFNTAATPAVTSSRCSMQENKNLYPPAIRTGGRFLILNGLGLSLLIAIILIPTGLLPISRRQVQAQVVDPCSPTQNPIVCENSKPGNPPSEWRISGTGDSSIQGFATDISVNRGQTIQFKVNTNASAYFLDIYRMGYYAGLGARKVATVLPSVPLPQVQPSCLSDPSTGLIDCGSWAVGASWAVPSTATSGIY